VVAGRVAVLITDESSKVNINTAGGQAVGPGGPVLSDEVRLTWAINEGVGAQEVDIRSVPNFDVITGAQVAQLRNGSAEGGTFLALNTNLNAAPYDYDAALPGYGGVDDNGSALWMALNGIDDDGDAYYYLYDGIDNDGDGFIDEADEYFLGVDELWEGIDEPSEHQLFRPLRNKLAETDLTDNDLDGSVDEIGELGDRIFRTKDQSSLVANIDDPIDGRQSAPAILYARRGREHPAADHPAGERVETRLQLRAGGQHRPGVAGRLGLSGLHRPAGVHPGDPVRGRAAA